MKFSSSSRFDLNLYTFVAKVPHWLLGGAMRTGPRQQRNRREQIVEGAEIPPSPSHFEIRRVILLGDCDTIARVDMLEKQASDHGATIVGALAIDAGEARSNDALQEVSAIVEALQQAT